MRDYWISRAIRICGSQKELARRIGSKQDKISYLLNEAKKISLEDALLIEEATGGVVTRYHLAERINVKIKRKLEEERKLSELRISERVALGISYEKGLGKRKGARNDLPPRENFPNVKGRTEQFAASYSGFGNYKTYHQAKHVVRLGTLELIESMDSKRIAISTAAILCELPEDEQHKILQLTPEEIISKVKYIKQTKNLSKHPINKMDLWWLSLQWCFHLLTQLEDISDG